MSDSKANARNALAVALSAAAHLVFLLMVVNETSIPYMLPDQAPAPIEPLTPRMDVEIIRPPPPPKESLKPPPPPTPPVPAPPKPPTPKTEPPRVSETPKPAPQTTAPLPTPSPRPLPKPIEVAPAPPKAAAPAPPAPTAKLNIHKPEKDAPAGVATLPLAPSPGPSSKSAAAANPATAAGAPGASRLSGLRPYPAGGFPSGGPGLRGTLVGCANADSVKLSGAERAHCNERFGVEMSKAPVLDGIAPSKRAAFDKASARQDADRRYRGAGTANNGAPSDPGGIAHGPASSEVFKHNAGEP